MFSYATTNAAAPPANVVRSNDEFYRALSQPSLYDPNPVPVFAERVPTPQMSWKVNPTTGHLMGTVRLADGRKVDGATIEILREVGPAVIPVKRTRTDGSGFFGAVDLEPGFYEIRVVEGEKILARASMQVMVGKVAVIEVMLS
jgi:hypothetical protein